jgi:putative glutamine amidotransferase
MMDVTIGIAGTLDACPATSPFSGWKRDITNEAYTSSLAKAGAIPLMLPVLDDPTDRQIDCMVDLCDGLLFPGGPDIDPSLYGREREKECGASDIRTDRFQLALFRQARKRGKPVLGICRGLQLINVGCGGTLCQEYRKRTDTHLVHDRYENPTEPCHAVLLQHDSALNGIFGTERIETNSLHHQQVQDVGRGMKTAALCEDGGIEALEAITGSWCIGVQWHPEAMMMASPSMAPLFRSFVYACNTARASSLAIS